MPKNENENPQGNTLLNIHPSDNSVGVISTSQSAFTFSAPPAIVTTVWKVLAAAIPSLQKNLLVPIVLSMLVGMMLYLVSAPVGVGRSKYLGFLFALLNSFTIAAAVLGIGSVISSP